MSRTAFVFSLLCSSLAPAQSGEPAQSDKSLTSDQVRTKKTNDTAAVNCAEAGKHITLNFDGEWPAEFDQHVQRDLAASLQSQNIKVCGQAGPARGALSNITIVRRSPNRIEISVIDHLTNKSVTRTIHLETQLEISSALVIAVATDELLRATWAELSLPAHISSDATETRQESATLPHSVTTKSESSFSLPQHRLALRLAFEAYQTKTLFYGTDFSYGSHFGTALEWTTWMGARLAIEEEVPDLGKVKAMGLRAGFSVNFPLIKMPIFSLGPMISTEAGFTRFVGDSTLPELGSDFAGWSLSARGGLSLRWLWQRLFFSLETQLGAPLVAIAVTDGSQTVGGVRGLEWSNALSIGAWWRQ